MKAPYRVLFSNDTTNIETCTSPYHRKGEPFAPEMLEATVDETAGTGVEVHMIQPGMGWVPWWKSKVYPFAEHVRFMKERFDRTPEHSGYAQYMASGGDMVEVFVRRCRARSMAPFVSFRLNDGHGHEFINRRGDAVESWCWHVLTPVHVNHPEWRIGTNLDDWNQRVLNWAIPDVRDLKFRFIEEICEQYDIDGFELDFMRHCSFFRQDETTSAQRRAIMTDFVRRVRAVLDRTARPGQHRWLSVRIPCHLATHDALGVDVKSFAAAGAEMFNLSPFYFTEQQTDAATIKKLLPEASVYLEMTHTTHVGPNVSDKSNYDQFTFRRTTDEQFYTAAHLAYARGLDGMSLFNFVYYREHGVGARGPFCEPPFHVLRRLGDPAWLAAQRQHWILAQVWDNPPLAGRAMCDPQRRWEPLKLGPSQTACFRMDLAAPSGGWKAGGGLRIQSKFPLAAGTQLTARFNGDELAPTDDVCEPYPNPYPPLLGTPETTRGWLVPASLLKDGPAEIEITMAKGAETQLIYLDLTVC